MGFYGWNAFFAGGTQDDKVSMCCNTDMEEICDEVAGILEGFGLLNQNAAQEIKPEDIAGVFSAIFPKTAQGRPDIMQTFAVTSGQIDAALNSGDWKALQDALNAALKAQAGATAEPLTDGTANVSADGNAQPDEAQAIFARIAEAVNASIAKASDNKANGLNPASDTARMPDITQTDSAQLDARARIKKLVEEYLCSFENTNKGAQGKNQNGVAQAQPTVLDQAGGQTPGISLSDMGGDSAEASQKESVSKAEAAPSPDSVPEGARQQQGINAVGTNLVQTSQTPGDAASVNVNAPADADMAENIARIVDSMSSRVQEGQHEFEIQLKPENLGKLSISLVMDAEGIRAHIKTADLSVRGLIASDLNILQDFLKEKGLNVVSMDVAYEAPAFGHSGEQSQRQQSFEGGAQNRRYAMKPETAAFSLLGDAMAAPDLLLRNSSVEFRA